MVAVLLGVTFWLRDQPWVLRDPHGLVHHSSLLSYGLGLGSLGLFWPVARQLGQGRQSMGQLLSPGFPTLDQVVLSVLIAGQLLLSGVMIVPEVLRELTPVGVPLDPGASLDLSKAWLLAGVLTLAWLFAFSLARPWKMTFELWVLAETFFLLLAHAWSELQATASALRWGLALWFLAGSALLWSREKLRPWYVRHGGDWLKMEQGIGDFRWLLFLGTVAPVLILTGWVAVLGFAGHSPAGPAADSWFAQIGWVASMVVPLGMIVAGLVGHALREDKAGYIFWAGLVLTVTVAGGYALGVVLAPGMLSPPESVFAVQLGILTLAGWELVWLWSGRWRQAHLQIVQLAITLAALAGVLVPAAMEVIWGAPPWSALVRQASGIAGWLALGLAGASALWVARLWFARSAIHVVGSVATALAILAACAMARGDVQGWRSYHVLTLGWTLAALFLLGTSWAGASATGLGPVFWPAEQRERVVAVLREFFPAAATRRWVEALGLVVVLMALGGAWADPVRPYWSCAATLAISVLYGASAVWTRRPGYVYASGLLLTLVAYLIWQAWLVDHIGIAAWFVLGPEVFDRFVFLQILALAIGSCIWSLVEIHLGRREPPVDLRARFIPYAHAAALAVVQLLAIFILAALLGNIVSLEIMFTARWSGGRC